MRRSLWLAIVALATPAALPAQTANPIVSSAKEIYTRQAKYIVAAFEEMPTEKYSYIPTPGAKEPRARALFELTGDIEDHYSQMAGYLRLNGLTPPSAAPHK
jgi:hypothetical protein